MNSNTKRSKKFREEVKKDPEKLEAFLKKIGNEMKNRYHERMAKLSQHEKEKLKGKDRLRKKKLRKRKKRRKQRVQAARISFSFHQMCLLAHKALVR